MSLITETCFPHIYISLQDCVKDICDVSIFFSTTHIPHSSYLTLLYLINSGSYCRMFKRLLLRYLTSLRMMWMFLIVPEYFPMRCLSDTPTTVFSEKWTGATQWVCLPTPMITFPGKLLTICNYNSTMHYIIKLLCTHYHQKSGLLSGDNNWHSTHKKSTSSYIPSSLLNHLSAISSSFMILAWSAKVILCK